MLYYKGERLEIKGSVGEVDVPGFTIKLVLLKCESLDTFKPVTRWRFREFLRADGGWDEITHKADGAHALELSAEELEKAITEARIS